MYILIILHYVTPYYLYYHEILIVLIKAGTDWLQHHKDPLSRVTCHQPSEVPEALLWLWQAHNEVDGQIITKRNPAEDMNSFKIPTESTN